MILILAKIYVAHKVTNLADIDINRLMLTLSIYQTLLHIVLKIIFVAQ